MYILSYLRLYAFFQPRHAPRNFLGIDVDWLLVSLRALPCNLAGCQVCEAATVSLTWKGQAFIPRPLLDDFSKAHRHFTATATDFKRGKRSDVFARQHQPHAVLIALHLHPRRSPPAGVHSLDRHLRLDFVTDFNQYALYFINHAIIDDIIVSNCHFSRVFSRFKAFLFFSNIIYQLFSKNRLETIFYKNKAVVDDTATARRLFRCGKIKPPPCLIVHRHHSTPALTAAVLRHRSPCPTRSMPNSE